MFPVDGRKQKTTNFIIANIRHGPSRTQKLYQELCADIIKAWDDIVGVNSNTHGTANAYANGHDKERKQELRAIFLLGGIVAGSEAGFPIPQAGQDGEWMKENWPAFERKAEEGDEDFVEFVREIKERGGEFGL